MRLLTARPDAPTNHPSTVVAMSAQTIDAAACAVVYMCMQWCWRTVSSYDGGMYVKQELVDRMRLTPQPPGVLVCGEGEGAQVWRALSSGCSSGHRAGTERHCHEVCWCVVFCGEMSGWEGRVRRCGAS